MTTEFIAPSQVNEFDYVIVGGGTAGCVIASRLSEYLPHKKILLIEAGPSDFNNDKVLKLKEWLTLLGGELDYDYGTTEQPMGKNDSCQADFMLLTENEATRTFDTPAQRSSAAALLTTP